MRLATAAAILYCLATAQSPPVRVLFIGNSLTYENNLPAMIEAVAAQAGLKGRVTCRGVALPDFGLQEHWEHGEALRAIRQGRWTHVVLQQGPSSMPDSRAVLREFAKKFAFEARAHGAKVVLYSPWTPRARLAYMDAVRESYRLAADDAGGALVAVGEAWREAWKMDPALPLYAADGFHPSPMGTYLAALTFFRHFTGRSPEGPPPDPAISEFRDLRIDAAQLKVLQAVAAK